MIIEDQEDNREMITVILEQWYNTVSYSDGPSGLRGMRECRPDLVVLDIGMAGMDGVDVLREIRSDRGLYNLPVIALTAYTMNGDREKYLAAGFDEHIPKPLLDFEELHRITEYVLARYRS